MPRWRIEKARAQGMAKDSLMWSQFYDEGAIKTVIKHHAKRLPMATDVEALFERDDTMAHVEAERNIEAEPSPPTSRLDALEHHIGGDDEPVVSEEEQAEELEAEITEDTSEHPGKALADEIIAKINDPECNAVMDVNRVLTKHELDIQAMLPEDGVRVEVAADKWLASPPAARSDRRQGGADGHLPAQAVDDLPLRLRDEGRPALRLDRLQDQARRRRGSRPRSAPRSRSNSATARSR
jgi:hypothetical protein